MQILEQTAACHERQHEHGRVIARVETEADQGEHVGVMELRHALALRHHFRRVDARCSIRYCLLATAAAHEN